MTLFTRSLLFSPGITASNVARAAPGRDGSAADPTTASASTVTPLHSISMPTFVRASEPVSSLCRDLMTGFCDSPDFPRLDAKRLSLEYE